jgi:hypothetical protein
VPGKPGAAPLIEVAAESEHLNTAYSLLPGLEKQFELMKKFLGRI